MRTAGCCGWSARFDEKGCVPVGRAAEHGQHGACTGSEAGGLAKTVDGTDLPAPPQHAGRRRWKLTLGATGSAGQKKCAAKVYDLFLPNQPDGLLPFNAPSTPLRQRQLGRRSQGSPIDSSHTDAMTERNDVPPCTRPPNVDSRPAMPFKWADRSVILHTLPCIGRSRVDW